MRVIGGIAGGVPLKGPPGVGTRPTGDKVRGAIFDALAAEVVAARVLDLYAGTGALGIEALSRGAAACLFVEKASAACRVIEANLRTTRMAEHATVWCLAVETALARLEALLPLPAAVGRVFLSPEDAGGGVMRQRDSPSPASGRGGRGVRDVAPASASRGKGEETDATVRPQSQAALQNRGRGVRDASLDATLQPPYNIIVLDPPYDDPAIVGVVERVGRSGLLAPGGFVILEHGKRLAPPHDPGMLHLRRTRRYGDTAVTIWYYQEDADG